MKKPSTDVIYLPGLGDRRSHGQRAILKLWKIYGLNVHYHKIGWADKEPYEPKKQRTLDLIDSLTRSGNKVALIGTSAGASAALNAYSERIDKVSSVVCICGKIQNPQTVGEPYFKENPAFRDSLFSLSKSLSILTTKDRAKVLSIHPLRDETVPVLDTIVEGAKEGRIPTVGHIFSIFYALTFGSRHIAKFIREKSA